jgi:hypothetical protein
LVVRSLAAGCLPPEFFGRRPSWGALRALPGGAGDLTMIELRKMLLVAATGLASSLLAQDPTAPKPPATGPEATPPATTAKPDAGKEVASLIRQLGSDSYRQRVDAERRLRELGEAALPALRDAAAQKDDAEVQWRARRLVRQLEGAAPLASRGRSEGGNGRADDGRASDGKPGDGKLDGGQPQLESAPKVQRRLPLFGGVDDDMRQQFQSLFERLERDFGVDVPRARFFDDSFFRDLQEQMQPGGGASRGMSVQIGPDGAVHVEVQQQNEKGEPETKVYDAPDMETFQREHPGVLQQNGLSLSPFFRGGRLFGGDTMPGFRFEMGGPEVQVLPFGTTPRRDRAQGMDVAPVAPPAGRRLGIGIRPEIPAELREYLELPEGTGLMVDSVQPDSLASALGLQRGDIVTKIGERTIGSPQHVQEALGAIEVGGDVAVTFVRKGKEQVATAKKAEASESAAAPTNGDEPGRDGRLQRRSGGNRGGTQVR